MAHELESLSAALLSQLGGGGGTAICASLSRWASDCAAAAAAAAVPQHQQQQQHHQQQQQQQQQQHNLSGNISFQAQANLLLEPSYPLKVAPADFLEQQAGPAPLTNLVTGHLLGPARRLEQGLDYYLSELWLASGDERTNRLPFIGAGPWKLLGATCVYLLLINALLPRLMRPFKPFQLNWPIRAYNFCMVLSNLWAFYHGARILNFGRKCFGCETIDHRDYSNDSLELLHYGWLFLLSRLVEWLDTVFFVLRKRERQVTKLHVFHHSFVPLISWTYLKYHPGYTVAFFPFVNSFVHSIMYTYYLLATFGPKVQRFLWWKRHLTSLQIAQFVLIIIQLASIPLTGDETCQYPRGFLYVAFAGALLFLWLFFTYYIDTYSKSRASSGGGGGALERKGRGREGSSSALSDTIDDAIASAAEHEPKKIK